MQLQFGYRHKQYSLLKKGISVYLGPYVRSGTFKTKPLGFITEEPFRLRPKDLYLVRIMKRNGNIMVCAAKAVYSWSKKDNGDPYRLQ